MKTYVKNLLGVAVIAAPIAYLPLHDAFITRSGVSNLLSGAHIPSDGLSIHRDWYDRGGAFDLPVSQQQFADFAHHYNLVELPSTDSMIVLGHLDTIPVRYSDTVYTQFFRTKNPVVLPQSLGARVVNVGYSAKQHRMFVIFYWPYG